MELRYVVIFWMSIFICFRNNDAASSSQSSSTSSVYDGYRIISLHPRHAHHVTYIRALTRKFPGLDLWQPASVGGIVYALVEPWDVGDLREELDSSELPWRVYSDDVKSFVDATNRQSLAQRMRRSAPGLYDGYIIDYSRYHGYEYITSKMRQFMHQYSDICHVERLKYVTHEGREMMVARLSKNIDHTQRIPTNSSKPVIIIEAGIHAREWIAPSAAMYFLERLLKEHNTTESILGDFEWYILPSVNPDGLEYSRNTFRFWRKNRGNNRRGLKRKKTLRRGLRRKKTLQRRLKVKSKSMRKKSNKERIRKPKQTDGNKADRRVRKSKRCFGVDLNRNFDIEWNTTGVSSDCNSNEYPGRWPFSEPESANLRDLVKGLRSRLVAYVALHSWSQAVLVPWAYSDRGDRPETHRELDRVAALIASAMSEGPERYVYGTPHNKLGYAASGWSTDWVLTQAPKVLRYNIELRPNGTRQPDRGFLAKFDLPAEEILDVGQELYRGLRVLVGELVAGLRWEYWGL